MRLVLAVAVLLCGRALAERDALAAYRSAERAEGKRSIIRRVLIIDALGASGESAARPFLANLLRAKPTYLRIAALEALPADALFGAVMVRESSAVKTVGPMKATAANRKKAVRFLAKHAPRGFRAELANIVTAMDMAELDPLGIPDRPEPRADTFFLVGAGSARGARYVDPRAALAAFERLNRFRRVVVHTIQTCNAGPEADRFLKGLANSSGGTYVDARRPPK